MRKGEFMKTLVVSNDWRSMKFSEVLRAMLPEEQKSLSENALRESEEVAFAMLALGWKSFAESHDGAIVYFYDETKVHPIIEEEEYGGENLVWLEGPGELDWGYCCTYDPTGRIDFDEDNETGFDAANDDYHPMSNESKFVFAERVVEGSSAEIQRILDNCKDDYLNQLSRYASLKVQSFFEMAKLKEEWQKQSFLYMYGNTCIPKEHIFKIACFCNKDTVFKMLRLVETECRLKGNMNSNLDIHAEAGRLITERIDATLKKNGVEFESV